MLSGSRSRLRGPTTISRRVTRSSATAGLQVFGSKSEAHHGLTALKRACGGRVSRLR
jgi:hypothetical protein